jgi:hypothetical protein
MVHAKKRLGGSTFELGWFTARQEGMQASSERGGSLESTIVNKRHSAAPANGMSSGYSEQAALDTSPRANFKRSESTTQAKLAQWSETSNIIAMSCGKRFARGQN